MEDLLTLFFGKIQRQRFFTGIDTQKISIHALFVEHIFANEAVWITVNRVFHTNDIHAVMGQAISEIG